MQAESSATSSISSAQRSTLDPKPFNLNQLYPTTLCLNNFRLHPSHIPNLCRSLALAVMIPSPKYVWFAAGCSTEAAAQQLDKDTDMEDDSEEERVCSPFNPC